ncbi:MAG: carbohydrate binding family 9 domain-containing protein [Cyclobacteriaceae bacterium]
MTRQLYFIALLCCSIIGVSQPYVHRIDSEIKIDGVVNEPVWESIEPLPLTQHWPTFQGEITERSEIRIAYDDEYIYLSARCWDSDATGIQGTSFQRDDISQKSDQVNLMLDPYNDNENVLSFILTPTAARWDIAVKNDAQGNDAVSFSWNSYWIGTSTVDDKGWYAEMRVPFASLRFQPVDGTVTMGMMAYRYCSRKREMNIFPVVRPDWGFMSFFKASQAQDVVFEGIENKRPWYTAPYALGGIGHHHEDNEEGVYERRKDQNYQVGLDIQHALTDNLNLDLTVNTDFAQVEADNQVINLSRFSIFLPEKRKFFLERSSTFDFKLDLNNNLFYSRRIGIQDGILTPMYGGARLVGRVGKWDVGLINMQSRSRGDYTSENFGVLRLRKNVLNPRSYIGGMMTSRVDLDGSTNIAYGIDGIINMFKQDYLQINVAQSYDTNDAETAGLIDKSRVYLMWENRIVNGFGYRFSYSNVGSDYNPGLGFERRFDFSQVGDWLYYSWFAPEESKLRQTTITAFGNASINNSSGNLETTTLGLSSQWTWDRDARFSVGLERFSDRVPGDFSLSDDILIVASDYNNLSASIDYSTPAVNFFVINVGGQKGTFYGGDLSAAYISPEIVFNKYLQMEGTYQYSFVNFENIGEQFRSHLGRINLVTSFSVKFSLSSFVQFNSLNELGAINARFRYNPVDGNDLYLVYNEALNTNPMSVDPELPISDGRAIMVKYIHTFRL